jgi:putative phosphoribosyl transferase
MFTDRTDAGHRLAGELVSREMPPDALVLGIPRGGVVVAAEVARSLGLPLDVVVAAKVGAPGNPEYAIGAVSADGQLYVNAASGFRPEDVRASSGVAADRARHALEEFRRDRQPLALSGRTAIVVDDGLATGLTARAAVEYVRRAGAKRVVLAVPVAAPDSVRAIAPFVDEVVALETPEGFSAVGEFYSRFGQTEDAEVSALLDEAARRTLKP